MSYTLFQQPAANILSANNPAVFVYSSSNADMTDFKYTAQIYFGLPNPTYMKTFPDPSLKYGVFDLSEITQNLTNYNYFPDGTTGFARCPDSSFNVEVFFGEEYISANGTFSQSIALASSSLLTFLNTSLSFPDQVNTDMNDYYIDGTGQKKCLVNKNNNSFHAYSNLNQWLYFYNASSSGYAANVYTYNSTGDNLGIYTVNNPYTAFDGVQAFGSGYKNLAALPTASYSVIDGSFPMITSAVSFYIINIGAIIFDTSASFLVDVDGEFLIDLDDAELIAAGSLIASGSSNSELYQYNVTPNCGKFAPGSIALEWLNTLGGIDSFLFSLSNQTSATKTQSQFKRGEGTLQSNGVYNIFSHVPQTITYYTEIQETHELNTNWLDDSTILFLKDLFTSPLVWMRNSANQVFPVCVKDDSYTISKKVNQKLFQLKLTVDSGFQNFRQRQ